MTRPAPPPRRRARQGGFTLVELLMGIGLASLFAAALYGFFFAGLDASRTHESQARAQADARTALERLTRDLRQAVSPGDGLTPPLQSLAPTALVAYIDPRRDASALVPRPHRVRYAVESGALVRERALPVGAAPPYTYGAYGAREVLATGIVNGAAPVFSAVTPAGAAMPATIGAPATRDAAQVSVRLRIAQRTGNAPSVLEIRTDVALRNTIKL